MRRLGWIAAALPLLVACGKKKEDPLMVKSMNAAKLQSCRNNLKQLWLTQSNYRVQYGGPQKLFPKETGGAFWLKLSRPPTVLIDASLQDVYVCPHRTLRAGATDYRGPSGDVNQFGGEDPVGACIGNHPDGSAVILRKSGDLQTAHEGDAICQKALERV